MPVTLFPCSPLYRLALDMILACYAYGSTSNVRAVICDNKRSLIDRKAGTSDIRYVNGLRIRDVHHHSGPRDALVNPNPLQCNLVSHANICCSSANCLLIEYKGRVVTVAPYHDEYEPMKVKIMMVTLPYGRTQKTGNSTSSLSMKLCILGTA